MLPFRWNFALPALPLAWVVLLRSSSWEGVSFSVGVVPLVLHTLNLGCSSTRCRYKRGLQKLACRVISDAELALGNIANVSGGVCKTRIAVSQRRRRGRPKEMA